MFLVVATLFSLALGLCKNAFQYNTVLDAHKWSGMRMLQCKVTEGRGCLIDARLGCSAQQRPVLLLSVKRRHQWLLVRAHFDWNFLSSWLRYLRKYSKILVLRNIFFLNLEVKVIHFHSFKKKRVYLSQSDDVAGSKILDAPSKNFFNKIEIILLFMPGTIFASLFRKL